MREYADFCRSFLFTLMENQKLEYRSVILFLALKGQSPSNIYQRMVIVYGDHPPWSAAVFEWTRRFKDGQFKITLDVVDQWLQRMIKLLKLLKV